MKNYEEKINDYSFRRRARSFVNECFQLIDPVDCRFQKICIEALCFMSNCSVVPEINDICKSLDNSHKIDLPNKLFDSLVQTSLIYLYEAYNKKLGKMDEEFYPSWTETSNLAFYLSKTL